VPLPNIISMNSNRNSFSFLLFGTRSVFSLLHAFPMYQGALFTITSSICL
jgi:hypothetical protein